MMQAAVQVFAQKGYHAATVRDVVNTAGVAIGTFYFYFPDKETLFLYLYEETADFLMQTIQQALNGKKELVNQLQAGLQAYINLGVYEPAIVQLLLVGGVGAVPSLSDKRSQFRERMTLMWKYVLDEALKNSLIIEQNTRRSAEMMAGGFDEIVLNLLNQTNPDLLAPAMIKDISAIALRLIGYKQADSSAG
ncbi:MAG: TetR/AcrR family transcriptional regulator [Candidatus Promineifilaceae bacterium]